MTRSGHLDFFAVAGDQRAILDFLFSATDVRVFDAYSAFDSDLREFTTTADVAAAWALGHDEAGSGSAIQLQLWSPSVMPDVIIERIALDPRACGGHTFRHRVAGGGLMQVYFGGIHGTSVTHSHFGHFSQARAAAIGVADSVDWPSLARLSARIRRHVRSSLGVGVAAGRPVLQGALDLARDGYALKHGAKSPDSFELVEPDVLR